MFAISVLLILGLCLGSFINAFVWRLHKKKDWVKGRSICVHCNHQLDAKDLIPVFSWLWLKGRCRYCKKPISSQYPLIELLTAAVFIISYIYWPTSLSGMELAIFALWLVFMVGLVALALYDLKWMLLPDKVVKPLYGLAVIQSIIVLITAYAVGLALRDILLSFLIGFGLFYLIFQISSGRWIGGGDVKLGGLLGLILYSPQLMLFAIFSASLTGSVYSIPLIASKKLKKDARIPFGPFLIIGAIIAKLFGQAIIDWYQTKVLYL